MLLHNDELFFGEADEVSAELVVHDEAFFKQVVLFGDVGFGEAYMSKLWDTPDLTELVSWLIRNMNQLPGMSGSDRRFNPINFLKVVNRISHVFKPNTAKGSRRNISRHYDLNNDFFRLFLDPSMTYSSALFTSEGMTLEQAQVEKYDHLCRSVKLNENDHVLEIGCGWGGFAVYAAKKYNCKVTGITISKEQYHYAVDRVKNEGLEDKVEFLMKDYRHVEGNFSKVVSIEMIEAVGHRYFNTYFETIDRLLDKNGVLGLQAIVIPDNRYDQYRKSVDWIQKHIFPGGLLPSIAKINSAINQAGNLNLFMLKEMGLSYARTLHAWYTNFELQLDKVKKLGFDEQFIRKWEYYLCSCEAAFKERNINVVQMVYARPNNPDF